MGCITCTVGYPTSNQQCPSCTAANPLFGVSTRLRINYHAALGTHNTSIVYSHARVSDSRIPPGKYKLALELYSNSAQRQYIIFECLNGTSSAVSWDPQNSPNTVPLPLNFRCSACPNLDTGILPWTLVASPSPVRDHEWIFDLTERSAQSDELSVVINTGGQAAVWTIHFSHQV